MNSFSRVHPARFVPVVVVLILGTAASSAAGQTKSQPAQSPDARANFAFDTGMEDGAAFARTFTTDGSLVRSGVTTTGHAALAALAGPRAAAPAVHTWMSNLVIEPSRDGDIGRVCALDFTSGAAGPVSDSGRFDDVLVKTREGWRFKTRVYASDIPAAPSN